MLFECMGICVLSPVHESFMRGYLAYLLIVKKQKQKQKLIDFVAIQPQYIRLDGLVVELFGDFLKPFQRRLWTISFKGIIERVGAHLFTLVWPEQNRGCLQRLYLEFKVHRAR